jgi:hypothetical protein
MTQLQMEGSVIAAKKNAQTHWLLIPHACMSAQRHRFVGGARLQRAALRARSNHTPSSSSISMPHCTAHHPSTSNGNKWLTRKSTQGLCLQPPCIMQLAAAASGLLHALRYCQGDRWLLPAEQQTTRQWTHPCSGLTQQTLTERLLAQRRLTMPCPHALPAKVRHHAATSSQL